jgi:phosphoribosyl-ATP pyrophosphohydrolase
MHELEFLNTLEGIIDARIQAGDTTSYTVRLAAGGPAMPAKKLGEEGVEVALAGVAEDADRLTEESADLLYHLLVLLRVRSVQLRDVVAILERRHSA